MSPPTVICCGLSCVDMELHACNIPPTLETVTTFAKATFTAGGCAPQTARALTSLSINTSVLSVIGHDPHGNTLRTLLEDANIDPGSLVVDPSNCTSLAVLPLFTNGTRGCFVTLGTNLTASVDQLLPRHVVDSSFTSHLRVFHFGYPHLMPQLQGRNLRDLFDRVRQASPEVIVTMDVNGADVAESETRAVLLPALQVTAAIHANLEEACVITGLAQATDSVTMSAEEIRPVVEWFTEHGAGIACVTCGRDGVFVATGGQDGAEEWAEKLRLSPQLERGAFLYRPAIEVTEGVEVNASGAGDAFMAGVIAELTASAGKRGIVRVAEAGGLSALRRLDSALVGPSGIGDIDALRTLAVGRQRIQPRRPLQQQKYEVEP